MYFEEITNFYLVIGEEWMLHHTISHQNTPDQTLDPTLPDQTSRICTV